ncbi:hypothetical protein [Mycolicibacterium llatzerense]|uniref:hypothetical protein n=1 Tax=Mycolicibacterium llatzerense TaxID=280871 RepID=UPI0021B57994|nr:hypothetical protein [Mycolicibacterium llatzerense]MCT7372715.1 hypothetical protein [Mycolicibacterium llatzerense]
MSDKTIAVLAGATIVAAVAFCAMGVAAACVMVGLVEANGGGVAIVAIPTTIAGYHVARLVRADIRGNR